MSTNSTNPKDTAVGRRTLLRRGSVVAAGVVGLAGLEAAGAGSADAAAGDPVLLGTSAQDSGTASTGLTSAAAAGTARLSNSTTGPALVLRSKTPAPDYPDSVGGGLYSDGTLYYSHYDPSDPESGQAAVVFTELTSSQLVTIQPKRMLDTRSASGRTHIANGGQLDSHGRLLAGHTLVLDLSSLADFAFAVYFNLTVTGPLSGSFLTVHPEVTRPGTSSINFSAGQTISNAGVVGLDVNGMVRIYAGQTTHVIVDVTALDAPSADWVLAPRAAQSVAPAARAEALRAASRRVAARVARSAGAG